MEDSALVTSCKQYKCSTCQLIFSNLVSMYKHKKVCNQDVKLSVCLKCGRGVEQDHFSCKDCDKCFIVLKSLQNHQIKHELTSSTHSHSVENTSQDGQVSPCLDEFKCNFCGKLSASRDDMNNHVRSHNPDRPYECEICGQAFAYRGNLKGHIMAHSKRKTIKRFKCNLCYSVFGYKTQIEAHAVVHTGIKPFNCDVCGKLFTYRRNMRAHRVIFHPEEPKPDWKELYNANSNDKWYTIQHKEVPLKTKDNNSGTLPTHSDEKLSCHKCPKQFSDLSSFLKHRRMHTDVKPYTCSFCNTGFCSSRGLRKHVSFVHAEEEANLPLISESPAIKDECTSDMPTEAEPDTGYKCVDCNKIFFQFGVFNRHKMTHTHQVDGQYQCNKTIKKEPEELDQLTTCNSQDNLSSLETRNTDLSQQDVPDNRVGRQTELKDTTPSASNTEYTCFICGIHFNNRFALRGHSRLHSDTEQFQCSCGKIFSYHSSMMKHERKHGSIRRYSCTDCGVYYLEIERLQIANTNKTHQKLCADLPKSFTPVLFDMDFRKTCNLKSFRHPSSLELETQEYQVKNPFVFIDCSACCDKIPLDHEITPAQSKKSRRNSKAEHSKEIKPEDHQCSHCTKVFANIGNLIKHVKMFHVSASKCRRCGLILSGTSKRVEHMRSGECLESFRKMSDNKKREAYKCPDCGKWFALKSDLAIHNQIHVAEMSSNKLEEVDIRNLAEHQHLEKQFKCEKCGLMVSTLINRKTHKRSLKCREAHRYKYDTCYTCSVCGQLFLKQKHLIIHSKQHRGAEQQFHCQTCGKEFSNTEALKKHESKHNRKPCDVSKNAKSLSSYLKMKRKMVGIKSTWTNVGKGPTDHTSNQKTGLNKKPCSKEPINTQLIEQANVPAALDSDKILSENYHVHNTLFESHEAQQISVHQQITESKRGTHSHLYASLQQEGSSSAPMDQDLLRHGNDEAMLGYRPYNADHNPSKPYQQNDIFSKITVFTDNEPSKSQQNELIDENKQPQHDDLMSQRAELTYQALLQDGIESFNTPSNIFYTSTCLQSQIMHSDLTSPMQQEGLHQDKGVSAVTSLEQEVVDNSRNNVIIDPEKLLCQLEDFNSQTAQISGDKTHNQKEIHLNMECDQEKEQNKDVMSLYSHDADSDHAKQPQQLDIYCHFSQEANYVQPFMDPTASPQATPKSVLQSTDSISEQNISAYPEQSLQLENINNHNTPNVEIDFQNHVEKGSTTDFYPQNTDNNTDTSLQHDGLNSTVSQNPCMATDKDPLVREAEQSDHKNKRSQKSTQMDDLEDSNLLDKNSPIMSGLEDLKSNSSVNLAFALHESWQQPDFDENETEYKHPNVYGSNHARETCDSNNHNSVNTDSKVFCDSVISDSLTIGMVNPSVHQIPSKCNDILQSCTTSEVQALSFDQPSDGCQLEPRLVDTSVDRNPLDKKCSPTCVESSSADLQNNMQCPTDKIASELNSKSDRPLLSKKPNINTVGRTKRRVGCISLKNAKQRQTVGGRFKSNNLKQPLPSSLNRARISQQKRDRPTVHECVECHNTFCSAFNLNRHMRTHSGEKPYKCSKCGLCFSDTGNLSKHCANVHRDTLPPHSGGTHECPKCDTEFISARQLKRHKCSATKKSTRISTPNDFGTENKDTLNHSMDDSALASIATVPITLNDGPENSIKIIFSSDSLFPDSGFVSHSMKVEETCESDAKNSPATDSSMTERDMPFECTDCGKRFPWLGNLKRHQRIHTDELNNSSSHKKDSDTLDKTQIIDIQPKLDCVSSSSIVPSQITNEQSSSQPLSQVGKKKCRFCDKVLPCLSKLVRHERTHTGERPYACLVCDKKYADSASLTKHSKSHSKPGQQVTPQTSKMEDENEHLQEETDNQLVQAQQMLQIPQQKMLLQQQITDTTQEQIPQIDQISLGQHQVFYPEHQISDGQQQIVQLNQEMTQGHQQIHQQMLLSKQDAQQAQEQHYVLHDNQSMLQEQQPTHLQIPLQPNQEMSQSHQTSAAHFEMQQQPYQFYMPSQQQILQTQPQISQSQQSMLQVQAQMPYQQQHSLQMQPEITHAQPPMLYVQPIQTSPQLMQVQPQMSQAPPQLSDEQAKVEQQTLQAHYIIPDVRQIPSVQQQIQQGQYPVLAPQAAQIQPGQYPVLAQQPVQIQQGQVEIMPALSQMPQSLAQAHLPLSQQPLHTENEMMQVEQQMLHLLDQIPQVSTQLPGVEHQISNTHVTEPIAILSPTNKEAVPKKIRAKPNQNPAKDHICTVCGKNFSNSYNVRRHMKLHTGTDTPTIFTCEVCNNTFTHRSNLLRHKRVHDRPHKCSQCTETFLYSTTLARHKCKATKSSSHQASIPADSNDQTGADHAGNSQLNSFDDQSNLYTCTAVKSEPAYPIPDIDTNSQSNSFEDHSGLYTAVKSDPPDPMPDIDDALNTILHSLDVKVEEDSKPYECSVCRKKFYNRAVLDHHYSRTHKY